MAKVRLRLARSQIGSNSRQRDTLRALGLSRIGSTSERPDNPAVRGMIAAVVHLVEIVETRTSDKD